MVFKFSKEIRQRRLAILKLYQSKEYELSIKMNTHNQVALILETFEYCMHLIEFTIHLMVIIATRANQKSYHIVGNQFQC